MATRSQGTLQETYGVNATCESAWRSELWGVFEGVHA
ncbi:hypothetical protein CABS01_17233 [Colletotrichum abscissum]|nr:uncharacterized protein CABS01_17233 [Colletotrichum abscissum]KAK1483417.1 hypothetical protein CABS01_17233 [Colletotrichum abscissum]